ncbi:MAG: hypothetical protein M1830_001781 [Pleopsidium flavum]|nr:MAG: hypothetical protein M1830_001781 [Pleopsidium flavum]
MSKRRRFDAVQNGGPLPDRAISLQRTHLEHEIEHGKKVLHRALKVARGFERQKLGRRQKSAKDKQDAARLEAEVVALKGLDLSVVAETHLHKTLLKSKSIASAPALPQQIAPSIERAGDPSDAARTNVMARLYNAIPIKTAMPEIMGRIRTVLGPADAETRSIKKARTDSNGLGIYRSDVPSEQLCASASRKTPSTLGHRAASSSSPDWTGFSGEDHSIINPDIDPEMNLSTYDARLAASSDSDSEGNVPIEAYTNDSRNMLHPSPADISLSRSPSISSSSAPPPSKVHRPKVASSAANSTFIPSLMGGYWSGSETAEEDDITEGQPRKNRMGQQARRQLWEKKYGRKANHVKGTNRDQDWDLRKGARNSDDRGKRGRGRGLDRASGHGRGTRDEGHVSGANSNPIIPRTKVKKEEGPLHPSWEAARKAKEQKKNVAFQGKRVVFD